LSNEFTKVYVLKTSLFTIRRTSIQKPCSEEKKLETLKYVSYVHIRRRKAEEVPVVKRNEYEEAII
jgi:hypothetical protein